MNPFRYKIPQHRNNRKECEHYSSYKDTLEADFNNRCGYCNDLNTYRINNFAIDHFVPQNPNGFAHNIKPNYYYNLVYSCHYCNNSKSNKWPTQDANIHNDGISGFVLPTSKKYGELLYRDKDGTILPMNNTPLASYIIKELNLKHPIHSLLWRFEKVLELEKQVKEKLKVRNDEDLKNLHYELTKEVTDIVRNIFFYNDK